ncbi:MAG: hypothetical protein LBB90_12065 [Tannerella sp.]|nr:hypothetical protein [Tannerella sp.]
MAIMCVGLAFVSSCDWVKDLFDKESDDEKIVLEEQYFSINNSVYMNESLPIGKEALISGLAMNKSAITGGSTMLQFTSSQRLATVHIGVNGVNGYYRCDVSRTEPVRNGSRYDYQIVLLLSQRLSVDFNVFLTALAVDGTLSTVVNSTNINVIEVGTGKLQVSLSWDRQDDVDLMLIDPNGNQVYYARPFTFDGAVDEAVWEEYYEKFADTGATKETRKRFFTSKGIRVIGELDLDSNAACEIDGVNNENITYEEVVVPGTYLVAVNLWQKCTDTGVKGSTFSVTAYHNGLPVRIADQQVGKFADNYAGNSDLDNDKIIVIGTFTVGGTRSAVPATLKPFIPDQKRFLKKGKKP